jgi:hypothetical protein
MAPLARVSSRPHAARADDTAQQIAVRYAGFALMACAVIVGEVLVRLDEYVAGDGRVRAGETR